MPLHLACARPLCRLKAPLGLSLLRKRGLVEKYRAARIYSPWRFLPPRNTPDLFCRRFTRQNPSLRLSLIHIWIKCFGGMPGRSVPVLSAPAMRPLLSSKRKWHWAAISLLCTRLCGICTDLPTIQMCIRDRRCCRCPFYIAINLSYMAHRRITKGCPPTDGTEFPW